MVWGLTQIAMQVALLMNGNRLILKTHVCVSLEAPNVSQDIVTPIFRPVEEAAFKGIGYPH